MGHLSKNDVREWLRKEQFLEKDILFIWEKLGGSAWEIARLLTKVKEGQSVENACEYFINDEYGKLFDYSHRALTKKEANLMQQIHKDIVKNGFALPGDYKRNLHALISRMVAQDFWFYRTDTQQITANSKSIRWAMKRILEHI